MSQAPRRQSGQALVLFALGIVGMVALMALVVDGGFVYVQRRTAQAAADAGALAAARSLRDASSLSAIRNAADGFSTPNAFGSPPVVQCVYLVDTAGAAAGTIYADPGATCPSGTATTINGASGVHVDVRITRPTFMAAMLGLSTLNADGHATAQLGTPSGLYTKTSPLIVCGGGTRGAAARVDATPPVTIIGGTVQSPPPTSLPTYTVSNNSGYVMEQFLIGGTIDASRNGHVYYLKGPVVGQANGTIGGSAVTNDCGAASNKFDGGAAPDQVLTSLPGDLNATSGNTVANIGAQVEAPGGCAGGVNIANWTAGSPGCVMILPVADGTGTGSSPSNPILHIQTMAAFYVWCNKSSNSGTNCQEWVGQLITGDNVVGNLLTSISISSNSPPSVPVAVHLTQ